MAAPNSPVFGQVRNRRHLGIAILLPIWLGLAVAGLSMLAVYQMRAGRQFAAPTQLAAIREPTGRATLYVFLHPQCGCSQATVSELERIQADTNGKLAMRLYFEMPTSDRSWEESPLYVRASAVRAWTVTADPGGRAAVKFGAATSGFTALFDSNGRKVFQGGVTPGRGHEGDSAGAATIIQFVKTGRVLTARTPVFGCALGNLGRT